MLCIEGTQEEICITCVVRFFDRLEKALTHRIVIRQITKNIHPFILLLAFWKLYFLEQE
jgi:hypothetical protein